MTRRVANLLQIDQTLLWALAGRIWQAVSGPVTIALVLRTLDPTQQGIYYTLVNIIGIQALFELGLLNVLISQAGHAQAAIEREGHSGAGWDRLVQLNRGALRWFSGAGLIYVLTAVAVGWLSYRQSDAPTDWQLPLLMLVPLAGLTMVLSPILAVLEGIGHRRYVYRLRLLQLAVGSVTVWSGLVAGFGLYALVVSTIAQVAFMLIAAGALRTHLAGRHRPIDDDEHVARDASFHWTRDVLPAQWRYAIASISYHLATQLFPLILLNFHSSIEAGRLGMTLTITTAIQMLASSWVQTKYSVAARQHGAGNREAAGEMWRRAAIISSIVLVAGFVTLAGLIPMLGWIREDLPQRFIDPTHVLLLGIGALAFHGVSLQSFYVLSRSGNPLLFALVIGSLAVGVGAWYFGYVYSIAGIVSAYAILATIVALPLHTIAYLKYRRDQ